MSIIIDGYELPDYVSYSSFTTYTECNWQYVLTRGYKVPEKPAWWFIGGNAVHEVTEALDREWLKSGQEGVSER